MSIRDMSSPEAIAASERFIEDIVSGRIKKQTFYFV